MLKNYIKIAFRNIAKHKVFSSLNITGLAAAISMSILLFLGSLWIFSFDRFHEDLDQLYQVYFERYPSTGEDVQGNMPVPLLPALKDEFDEIEAGTRWLSQSILIDHDGELYRESVRLVDADMFKMFNFPLIHGDPETVLDDLDAIVITERIAEKVFGKVDAGLIGKTLRLYVEGQERGGRIAGISQDTPENSSLRLGITMRFEQAPSYQGDKDRWNNYNHNVYVKLPQNVLHHSFEERLTPFIRKYFAEDLEQLEKDGGLKGPNGEFMAIRLMAMDDIKFDTRIGRRGVNRLYPILLGVLGIFILLIACINYVNLSLGVAMTRGREVGVRKALGANRNQLLSQFWWESLLTALIATLLGLTVAQFILPKYNALFDLPLRLDRIEILWVILGILAGVGLLAGLYPAWVLSRFQTTEVLKNNIPPNRSGKLRNVLVVVQFAISILLICCTLVVGQQLQFMRNKPLGFNKEEVVSIPIPSNLDGAKVLDRMRQELSGVSEIVSLSAATNNLGMGKDGSAYTSMIGFEQDGHFLETNWLEVDYDYLKTLEIELREGRTFSKSHGTDSTRAIIVNESMEKLLGEGSAIGKIMDLDEPREVVGVVKNYHFQALDRSIGPLSMILQSDFRFYYIFVRVNTPKLRETLAVLENTWEKVTPGSSFRASFLDENTARMYEGEERMGQMLMGAGLLAIVLSCMGLLGISIFTLVRRTKEIGIRKVLGANVWQIVGLISRESVAMVLIASLLASPFAAWGMQQWLGQFEYSITLSMWVFVLAAGIALLIALLTICIQTLKAAVQNPIRSLRYE